MSNPLYVTQPHLPPLEDFMPLLKEVWDSRVLTNGGPFHQRFERALCEYLDVKHISLFTNATIGLVTALQALRIAGEVITTPYSFVATAHSLLWNGIKPIFVDVDPDNLNIDPAKIEAAITSQTTAILAVHVYGHPCNIDAIQRIADNYNLRVIYDAAHAFGVKNDAGSVLNHGDLSVLSFHATKVFNTFEGGAVVSSDEKIKRCIDYLKNFGFIDEVTVVAPGINGKMSEFNAALGLLQLQHVDAAIDRRQAIAFRYRDRLAGVRGIRCLTNTGIGEWRENFGYFPVLVDASFRMSRDDLYQYLKQHGIFARRYFFPLLSNLPMYRGLPSAQHDNLPVANAAAAQVLCLPMYPVLPEAEVDRVSDLVAGRT